METHRQSNGWQTFFGHWGFSLAAVCFALASQILMFLHRLTDGPWIWLLATSFELTIAGGTLIGFAKLHVYRSGRWFTFGVQSVPEHLKTFYRWGWCLLFVGSALTLYLLLSRS